VEERGRARGERGVAGRHGVDDRGAEHGEDGEAECGVAGPDRERVARDAGDEPVLVRADGLADEHRRGLGERVRGEERDVDRSAVVTEARAPYRGI